MNPRAYRLRRAGCWFRAFICRLRGGHQWQPEYYLTLIGWRGSGIEVCQRCDQAREVDEADWV